MIQRVSKGYENIHFATTLELGMKHFTKENLQKYNSIRYRATRYTIKG